MNRMSMIHNYCRMVWTDQSSIKQCTHVMTQVGIIDTSHVIEKNSHVLAGLQGISTHAGSTTIGQDG